MKIWKIYQLILALYHIKTGNADNFKRSAVKQNSMIVFPQDVTCINENNPGFDCFQTISGVSFENVTDEKIASVLNSFNVKLYAMMSSSNQHQNLVFSPISLESVLGFFSTISNGKLRNELRELLQLPNYSSDVDVIFQHLLESFSSEVPPTFLIVANKLYYNYQYGPISDDVHRRANKSFACELEGLNFVVSKNSADIINTWVSEKTRNLIQNIITPSTITENTSALMVNSIYFKSDWLNKFDVDDTEVETFYMNKSRQVPVDMMYNEDVFRYGDFSKELQATAVELPYKSTNLSMLLLLPNKVDGLAELERKLPFYDLQMLSKQLSRQNVVVKLPKFKIEYETDVKATLQKMGLKALFNNEGGINLFQNQQHPFRVDQFKHKAVINVNEAGTEAAAVSAAKYIPLSAPHNVKHFTADHPFVFAVRHEYKNALLFMGHVTKF